MFCDFNMDLEVKDFGQICRTCQCITPHMRSIFEGYQNACESPRINEMLMTCASVQVAAGDGLPSQICQICIEQLNNAFVFKHQCEKSDANLREYAKNIKVNEIKEELQSSDCMESLDTLSNLLNGQQSSSSEMALDEVDPLVNQKIETDYSDFINNIQMPVTCLRCAKIFTTLEDLRYHECIPKDNIHISKHCDKEYTTLNHLRHKRSRNKKKVYVCKICQKACKKLGHLKEHLTTHLKKKPFSCKACNRGFNRPQLLQIHIPKCKADTLYRCDICNKNFNRENNLEVHKKTHDNQQLKLLTIENLDKIEDYYYEMDEDTNPIFSNNSNMDHCFEPQIGANKSMDENKIKEVSNTTQDDESETSAAVVANNDNSSSMDKGINDSIESEMDIKEEKMPIEVKEDKDDNDADVEGLEVYNCKVCNKEFSKAGEIKEHINSQSTDKPLQCMNCTKNYNGKVNLNKQQKWHERQSEFECDVCQKLFSGTDYLAEHKASKHGISKELDRIITSHVIMDYRRGNKTRLRLSAKRKKNHNLAKYNRARQAGLPYLSKAILGIGTKNQPSTLELPIPDPSTNPDDEHVLVSENCIDEITGEKKYECSLCQKSFTTEKYRDLHMIGHNGQKGYQCDVCKKTFHSEPYLIEHMKCHDEHSKKFLCSECGQIFIRNDCLVVHLRRHRGEKPFKCKFCDKGFPRATDLTAHERCHTGEKTHLCTICGKAFGRSYNLTLHMRTHTGEKPYQCTYCDAAFTQGGVLKSHLLRHTAEKFKCKLCMETFITKKMLSQHKHTIHGKPSKSSTPADIL